MNFKASIKVSGSFIWNHKSLYIALLEEKIGLLKIIGISSNDNDSNI